MRSAPANSDCRWLYSIATAATCPTPHPLSFRDPWTVIQYTQTNMPKIAIVTSSAANLPPSLATQYGVEVVPIYLHWGDRTYRDSIDISPDEVYQRLRSGDDLPTTAAPSPEDFVDVYRRLGRQAEGVVSVHMPPELSATIGAARIAAEMVADTVPVCVIDSGTAAMGLGFVALAAARAAEGGADLEEVANVARAVSARAMIFVMLDTFEYLHRSGRIGKAASLMGAALQIKPIVCVRDNVVHPVARPRTRSRAVGTMLDRMAEQVKGRPVHVGVTHANAPEPAKVLRELVEERFNCVEVLTTAFTPVMGVSAGPGVLGVAFYTEDQPAAHIRSQTSER